MAARKYHDVYVLKITWDNDLGPLIGPVIGITRATKLRTVIRKRLKANNQSFKSVTITPLNSVRWFFGFDNMMDPVDRLLNSIGEESYAMIEDDWDPRL